VCAFIAGALAYLIMSKLSILIDPLLVTTVFFTSGLLCYLLASSIESYSRISDQGDQKTDVTPSIELKSAHHSQIHHSPFPPHHLSPIVPPPSNDDTDLRSCGIEGSTLSSTSKLGSELGSSTFHSPPSPTSSSSANHYDTDPGSDLRRSGQGSLRSPSTIELRLGSILSHDDDALTNSDELPLPIRCPQSIPGANNTSLYKMISSVTGYVDYSLCRPVMTMHL
jgi:hypothetical protein